jgi:transposase
MFTRVKKSGPYQYLQIVENHREGYKTKQRVICTLGRLEALKDSRGIESLVRSLTKYTPEALMILSQRGEVESEACKIGPPLVFDRLWQETGIQKVLNELLKGRRFSFDVEREIFLTVLHRLMVSGSDRFCDSWRRSYQIAGTEELALHHSYRAMAFLGEEIAGQVRGKIKTFRTMKDVIEERLFDARRDMFTGLQMVFFDTTSIYFEGEAGEQLGEYGYSKDHRSDRYQMIVGVVLDEAGMPISCEMWPGNTADVNTLLPVVERLKNRFGITDFCVVADRGMVSEDTIEQLEKNNLSYILGARMKLVKEIGEQVLTRPGSYCEIYPEDGSSKGPDPLKVKDVRVYGGKRYILCYNERQAFKDASDRELILEGLKEKIKSNPKSLVQNKGYQKYLKIKQGAMVIDQEKVDNESRFDGKWVLRTNTALKADQVALKYKELWQVEQVFRDVKSVLETRPVYHRLDETIRGHVFCSFLALILKKELDRRLQANDYNFEWNEIREDLKSLQEVMIKSQDKTMILRTQVKGACGKIFQSTGVAIPPTIRIK